MIKSLNISTTPNILIQSNIGSSTAICMITFTNISGVDVQVSIYLVNDKDEADIKNQTNIYILNLKVPANSTIKLNDPLVLDNGEKICCITDIQSVIATCSYMNS
jgi:hypothetical protein